MHWAQEATLALNEALHIAQQSNDHVALAHTLATLTSLLDSASPELAPAVQETRGLPGPHTKHLQLLRLLRRSVLHCFYGSGPWNLQVLT